MPILRSCPAAFARRAAAARCSSIFGKLMPVENHTSSTPARYFANCSNVAAHTSGLSVCGFRRRIAEKGMPSAAAAAATAVAAHAATLLIAIFVIFRLSFLFSRGGYDTIIPPVWAVPDSKTFADFILHLLFAAKKGIIYAQFSLQER